MSQTQRPDAAAAGRPEPKETFFTKAKLVRSVVDAGGDPDTALVVSMDRPDPPCRGQEPTYSGKKAFLLCRDAPDYVLELSSGRHRNEVLPHKTKTPSWLYMDIDEKCDADAEAKEAKTRKYVRRVAKAFLLDPDSAVGRVMQVLTSHTPSKLSVHIVINIPTFPAEAAHRMKLVSRDRVPWDDSVYSMFRSFRAAYHSKGGRSNALRPWGASSRGVADHLVRILPGHGREIVTSAAALRLPPNAPKPPAPGAKRPRSPGAGPGSEDGGAARAAALAALERSDLLQTIGAPSLESALGAASFRDGGALQAYVRNGFTCPFKRKRHTSNQGWVWVRADGSAEYRCLSPACRGCLHDLAPPAVLKTRTTP